MNGGGGGAPAGAATLEVGPRCWRWPRRSCSPRPTPTSAPCRPRTRGTAEGRRQAERQYWRAWTLEPAAGAAAPADAGAAAELEEALSQQFDQAVDNIVGDDDGATGMPHDGWIQRSGAPAAAAPQPAPAPLPVRKLRCSNSTHPSFCLSAQLQQSVVNPLMHSDAACRGSPWQKCGLGGARSLRCATTSARS